MCVLLPRLGACLPWPGRSAVALEVGREAVATLGEDSIRAAALLVDLAAAPVVAAELEPAFNRLVGPGVSYAIVFSVTVA